jgi:hypothetical protein
MKAFALSDTERTNAGGEAALTAEEHWLAQALTSATPGASGRARVMGPASEMVAAARAMLRSNRLVRPRVSR